MGFFKKSVSLEPKRTALTIIAKGNKISGDMVVTGKLHIDGCVEGSITSIENVSIGKTGIVNGKINAKNITVSGLLEGEVSCEHLHIVTGGRVVAAVLSVELTMDAKSQFVGVRKECAEYIFNIETALAQNCPKKVMAEVEITEPTVHHVSDIIENLPNKVILASVIKSKSSLAEKEEPHVDLDFNELRLSGENSKLLTDLDLSFLNEKKTVTENPQVDNSTKVEVLKAPRSANPIAKKNTGANESPSSVEMIDNSAVTRSEHIATTETNGDDDIKLAPAKAKIADENTTKLELKF